MTTSPGTAIRRSKRHNHRQYNKTRYMDDYQVHDTGLARHNHNSAVSDRDDGGVTGESQKTAVSGDTDITIKYNKTRYRDNYQVQTVGLAKRTRREQSSTVSDGDDVVITGQNEKDSEQQRRKSPRATAGKGTRKKYADDTVVQEQLAKTSTKGNRESIQSETTTREVSGRDMDNDEVLTALELADKMVQSQTAELHNDKRTIKCKNSRNAWSIISCYLSICISSMADALIHVIRSVRTFSMAYFQ